MTFANPWLLLGASAALVPLLVHLFDRRRPRPHPFGAISFVLRSQRRTASRLKLKRLILYCLRTLILLALPVALARPEWRREVGASASARGPAATSIVLDSSLSMRWSDGKSLFLRGREEAREALRDLLPEEPANVVLCGPLVSPPPPPTSDRAQLRAQLDEAEPSYGPSDLVRCMELGARSLEESPLPSKRLVVISDFTQGSLRLEAPPPTVAGPKGERIRPEVVLRDAARGEQALPNRAVVDLKVEPALQVGPRAFQFTFTVRNFSSEPVKDLEASLKVEGQVVAKGFLDISGGGTAQKSLTHRFDSGGLFTGEVSISADALAEDDRRAFVLNAPKELRALVVNGSPSTVRYRDEAFFVEAALTAPGSPLHAAVRDVDSAFREDFSSYQVVLLLNVPAPTKEQSERLGEYVRQGGSLFLSMGDNVAPETYNQRLGAVLPRRLRDVKTSVDPSELDAAARAAKLANFSSEHPVFTPFTGRAREGLMSSRFYRYVLLEAEAVQKGEIGAVLATLEDGAPAVAVAARGRGRVMLFTSTVDRDWGDFAIRTSFLPLMQRFCAFLAGSLDEREEHRPRVGETLSLRLPKEPEVERVASPSGGEVPLSSEPDGPVQVGPIAEPGVHTAFDSSGRPLAAFAAVLDPSESDLTRIRREELTQHFGEDTVRTAGGQGAERKAPFWTWLIVAAAAAFLLEGVLLRR
ncbi:MAG: BatA domain-containing protein [Myxococcales bacterium]|nr:BatA domain-containing protein [Myxococcales bacterium]